MAARASISVMWESGCLNSAWHKQIFDGLRRTAGAAQCTIHLIEKNTQEELSGQSDPVVLIGYTHHSLLQAVRMFADCGKRVILAGMDADSFSGQVSCVTHSRSQQTIQMLQYLFGCAKHRIALVGIGRKSFNDMVKVEAAQRYSREMERPIGSDDVFGWNKALDESFTDFLSVWQQYDAVICPNDYAAFALLRRLQSAGVRVPEDLYLVGFSDQIIDRYCTPAITSITMDYSAIGRYTFAIWQQLQTLTEPELVCKLVAPSRLMIRGSTAFQPFYNKSMPALLSMSEELDLFYHDTTVQRLMKIENCLTQHDELDRRIIAGILGGISYETLAGDLYISLSALHYRISKLFRDLDVRTRVEFTDLFARDYGTFAIPPDEMNFV